MSEENKKRKLEEEQLPEDGSNQQNNSEESAPKKQKTSAPSKALKVLVCGDVRGKFHKLFSTAHAIDQSAQGPFHFLLCVGQFFAAEDDEEEDEQGFRDSYQYVAPGAMKSKNLKGAADEESFKYLTGESKIMIPTYFVHGGSPAPILDGIQEGGDVCENLHFLGRYGMKEMLGLKICYLSGVFEEQEFKKTSSVTTVEHYREEDIKQLQYQLMNQQGKVDILLTCEWPLDVLNFVKGAQMPKLGEKNFRKVGSAAVKSIAKVAAPRYHFCGKEGVYFARLPYKTIIKESGEKEGEDIESIAMSRFISLAPLSESKEPSAKFIYAASVTPLKYMTPEQVYKSATNYTDSPFEFDYEQYVKAKEAKQKRKEVVEKPQPDCWFCLSSPHVEKHLLVSLHDEAYLALPKGGLVDDHVLIISVSHSPNYASLPMSDAIIIEKYKQCLKKNFADQNKSVIFFERSIAQSKAPQHMHIQAVPIPNTIQPSKVISQISSEAKSNSMEFQIFDAKQNTLDILAEAEPQYIFFELADNTKLLHNIKDFKTALNFGRAVVAKILGAPERENWKECALTQPEEKKLAVAFRRSFMKYDWK